MATTIRWQARRGNPGSTFQACLRESADLGRLAHVHAVLQKTFSGAQMVGGDVVWSKEGLAIVARPEAVERPRFVDFEVSLEGIELNDAVVKLSPRLRRLGQDRNWAIFDSETEQPLLLAPASRAPRRKKGLITVPIDADELVKELALSGSGQRLIIGGFAEVKELDAFFDRKPPAEMLSGLNGSFGWTNVEVRLPSGTRFFAMHFRGQAAGTLHDWYKQLADLAGLPTASVSEGVLRVETGVEANVYSLADCHAYVHNVWQSSVATKH